MTLSTFSNKTVLKSRLCMGVLDLRTRYFTFPMVQYKPMSPSGIHPTVSGVSQIHHTQADCPCVPKAIARWGNLQASPSRLLLCYRSFGLIDIQKSRYTHHKV